MNFTDNFSLIKLKLYKIAKINGNNVNDIRSQSLPSPKIGSIRNKNDSEPIDENNKNINFESFLNSHLFNNRYIINANTEGQISSSRFTMSFKCIKLKIE